ncbi:TPA: Wzy polymerase domain-containing protein [Serratia fonticola]|uniref:PglL family O-oligosaccharyltransferase n=1 Tax=Serratia fonticola TaxID=47917 RepID=UPI0021BB6D51|nr:Wzy polymerase domain-containing protein [Serratia fonticola]
MWLLFILPLYLPNMGGGGLKLPQNIIAWGVMAAVITTIWLSIPTNKTLRFTTASRWIMLAVPVLAIPLFYTIPEWRDMAFACWLALVGGAVFYLSLLQYAALHRWLPWLLYGILAAAALQAGIALLQFITPDAVPGWLAYPRLNGRPYGVFQQVNVLASFIATGLALALVLSLLPGFSMLGKQAERARQCALGLLLLLFPALLVWLQSRIGWLGGGVSGGLLLLLGWKTARARTFVAAGIIMMSISFAFVFQLNGNIADVEHTGSNHARLTMLSTTLDMITEQPWQGWGYGGFEYSFQHYRLAQGLSTQGLGVVTHPHNELLLWWAEGGVVALIGMLILIYAGAKLVWRVCRPARHASQQQVALAQALSCVLLPILLHTQTEYPFSLSTAHWTIFLLLLAQLDRLTCGVTERRSLSAPTSALLSGMIPALSIAILLLAGCGLYANLALTTVERNHLADIEPARAAMKYDLWVNSERWRYDQQTHALLAFNQTRDPALLDGYARWAQGYLSHRVDNNVYASWLAIAQYQQDAITHSRLRQEAHSLFPDDTRFLTPFIPQ